MSSSLISFSSLCGPLEPLNFVPHLLIGHPVRLIGPSRCAGRVEIYIGGWKKVCDDDWDLKDAQVVCRQLGCGSALAAPHSAYFGRGTDTILLDDVACTGSETYLTECPQTGFLTHNCTHSQEAGVICSGGEKVYPCSINIVLEQNQHISKCSSKTAVNFIVFKNIYIFGGGISCSRSSSFSINILIKGIALSHAYLFCDKLVLIL